MRLEKIRGWLTARGIVHQYHEADSCGSVDFVLRGLAYHVWEYPPEEQAAESNLKNCGKMEVYEGDYETQLLALMEKL